MRKTKIVGGTYTKVPLTFALRKRRMLERRRLKYSIRKEKIYFIL